MAAAPKKIDPKKSGTAKPVTITTNQRGQAIPQGATLLEDGSGYTLNGKVYRLGSNSGPQLATGPANYNSAPKSSGPNAVTGGTVNYGRTPLEDGSGYVENGKVVATNPGAAAQQRTLSSYNVPDLQSQVSAGFPQSIAGIEQNFKDVYREIALREAAAQQSGKALTTGTNEQLDAGEQSLKTMGSQLGDLGTSALGGLGTISLGAELAPALGSLALMRAGEGSANRFLAPGLTTFFSGIRSQTQAAEMAALAEERMRQQEALREAAMEQARLQSALEIARMEEQGLNQRSRETNISEEKRASIYANRESGNTSLPGGLPNIPDDSFGSNEISGARGLYFSNAVKQNLMSRPAYNQMKNSILARMQEYDMDIETAFQVVAAKFPQYGMTLSLLAAELMRDDAYAEVEQRFGKYIK